MFGRLNRPSYIFFELVPFPSSGIREIYVSNRPEKVTSSLISKKSNTKLIKAVECRKGKREKIK